MQVSQADLISILMRFNPWWKGRSFSVPAWHRPVFQELYTWMLNPPAPRALFLSGARQVGKTTLLLQLIKKLVTEEGIPAPSICFCTMDHPLLKRASLDYIVQTLKDLDTAEYSPRFLFIDEIQCVKDWETWIKFAVDFSKDTRIIFTGSALPLSNVSPESGVGRWHTFCIYPLSFFEYVQIRKTSVAEIPPLESLSELFRASTIELARIASLADDLKGHFYEYLLRGGFPQTALVSDIDEAERLIREDILDKIIKRDMTEFFGVRHVLDLESIFLYICMHDGNIVDIKTLCENLEIKRPTAQAYIEILESAHLLTKLKPLGYGKDILRGRFKIYLNDPALYPAVFLKGKDLLYDQKYLGQCVETAVFQHLIRLMYKQHFLLSYWQNKKKQEVDFIALMSNANAENVIPFEVKYREQNTDKADFPGLVEFFSDKKSEYGYIITKNSSDIGLMPWGKIMKIPAHLFCWWISNIKHL